MIETSLSSFRSMAQALLLRSHKPKQYSTGPVDKDESVFPKRFNKSRDVYHTTNSRGEVVEIANPGKQFKSELRKAKDADLSKPAVDVGRSSKPHSSKPYHSISLKKMVKLTPCLNALVKSTSDSQLAKSPAGIFLARYNKLVKNPNQRSPTYARIPKTAQYNKLREAMKLTACHIYWIADWPRVRDIIMDVIESLGLQCILEDTYIGYKAEFPFQANLYTAVDLQISHTIMSLIHCFLFQNAYEELVFYKELGRSNQVTKTLIERLNMLYKHSLEMEINDKSSGAGYQEVALRQVPVNVGKYMMHGESISIKRYTHGLSAQNFQRDTSLAPWYVSAQKYLRAAHGNTITVLESLDTQLDEAEKKYGRKSKQYRTKMEEFDKAYPGDVFYYTIKDYRYIVKSSVDANKPN